MRFSSSTLSDNVKKQKSASASKKMVKNSSNSSSTIRLFPMLISSYAFSRAVAARVSGLNNPPLIPGSGEASKPKAAPQPPRAAPKKDAKKSLKGIVVRKKTKLAPVPPSNKEPIIHSRRSPPEDLDSTPDAKRRKVSDVSS